MINKGNIVITRVIMISVFRKRKKQYALMLGSRPLIEAGIFLFVLHLQKLLVWQLSKTEKSHHLPSIFIRQGTLKNKEWRSRSKDALKFINIKNVHVILGILSKVAISNVNINETIILYIKQKQKDNSEIESIWEFVHYILQKRKSFIPEKAKLQAQI